MVPALQVKRRLRFSGRNLLSVNARATESVDLFRPSLVRLLGQADDDVVGLHDHLQDVFVASLNRRSVALVRHEGHQVVPLHVLFLHLGVRLDDEDARPDAQHAAVGRGHGPRRQVAEMGLRPSVSAAPQVRPAQQTPRKAPAAVKTRRPTIEPELRVASLSCPCQPGKGIGAEHLGIVLAYREGTGVAIQAC